jgi:transposase
LRSERAAKLAKASLKNKRTELIGSLNGFYNEHFRWLLSESVQELSYLDRGLEEADKRLVKQLQPHADVILRLCTIPGVDFTTAVVILAEIGLDMSRFAEVAHLASWSDCALGTTRVRASATRGRRARAISI